MTQREDPPGEFTLPGKLQRAVQRSWTIRTGEGAFTTVLIRGHGHAGWAMPFAARTLIQPQDGAVETRSSLLHCNPTMHESEDAYLTGGTRSLDRRLLGLNIVQDYLKRENGRVTAIPPERKAEVA